MNFAINYFLKACLNLIVVIIVIGACILLGSTVGTEAEIEAAIKLERFTENIIEKMPRIGSFAAYVYGLFGIPARQGNVSEISILSEITYIMILSTVYQIMFSLQQGIKRFADRVAPSLKTLMTINDLVVFCMIALSSMISATILQFFVERSVSRYGYGAWATMISCLIVIITVCVVKNRGNLRFTRIVFELMIAVVNALALFIVCALVGMMDLVQYATGGEAAFIAIALVVSTLVVTFCFAYAVSTIATK